MKNCFIFLLLTQLTNAQSWQQVADFPATERDDAAFFVIGDKAYCGTGLKTGWVASNDFYAFDMSNDSWSTIATLPPGMERQYASGFSYSNKGFIFGGVNGNTYYNDLWLYNPANNSWQNKTSLPDSGRMGASCFVVNDTCYVIGGRTSTNEAIEEFWAYSITSDVWVKKNNLPFGTRWRAAAVASNSKGYLFFGRDTADHFYRELLEFDPSQNTWSQLSIFPNAGRTYVGMQFLDNHLIIVGGLDSLQNSYNDLWSFSLDSLEWKQLNSIPAAGRRGGVFFNNASTLYYTTGIDENNIRLKETWKVHNPLNIPKKPILGEIILYPNPAKEILFLELPPTLLNHPASYKILDPLGKIVHQETISKSKTEINISHLAKGIYIFLLRAKSNTTTIKIVKF